jgi:hypothetical protein
MKIEVDIPDRYAKANLYVFAGLQPVARSRMRKGKRGPWEIKTAECSRCGECCLAIKEDHPLGTPDGCAHLERGPGEQLCGLGILRPHGCAVGENLSIESCAVRWEAVD